jgi:SAM-dependent methyltransferase
MDSMLPFSEACERNKNPILEVLRVVLADRARVLEIGSGTGQHAVYFAAQLGHLHWYPTEQLAYLADLTARVQLQGTRNLHAPTVLDVKQSVWPVRKVDAVFTANTLHIMAWTEAQCLFRGLDAVLSPGGVLCIYGPFRYAGRYTSASNQTFDAMLQERDPLSGIRDIDAVTALARHHGMTLNIDHDMPANNRLLQFLKD